MAAGREGGATVEATDHSASTRSRLRHDAFLGVAFLVLIVLFIRSPLALLWLGWFLDETPSAGGRAAVEISHRVHEISFGALFGFVFAGVFAQLRSPERNIAGMQQAVLTTVVFTAVVVRTGDSFEPLLLLYLVPVVLIALLHPARRQLVVPKIHLSRPLAVATVLAAPALLAMAGTERDLALNRVAQHVEHWAGMASFALAVLLLAVLAALGTPGWRVPAWCAGLGMLAYAAVSIAFPDDASAAGTRTDLWPACAIVWGVAFLVLTEREVARREGRVPPTPVVLRAERPAGRALVRAGLIAIGVVLGVPVTLGIVFTWAQDSTPVITHAVSDARRDRAACVSCHDKGVRPDVADSPHPERRNCLGCHRIRGFPDIEGAVARPGPTPWRPQRPAGTWVLPRGEADALRAHFEEDRR